MDLADLIRLSKTSKLARDILKRVAEDIDNNRKPLTELLDEIDKRNLNEST